MFAVQTVSKGAFHREMTELRRKIKTTQTEAQQFDDEIAQLKLQQQQLAMMLDERQVITASCHKHECVNVKNQ